jgi:phosphohistidine phosphatase
VQPEVVVHSPLVRAVETAAMAGEILAPPGGLHEDERLACGASLADVRAVVAEHPGETVMLVGHNPDFSEITGELIGGGNVALRTSGIACVSLPLVAAGAGVLEWLIKPRLFGDR